MFVLTEVQKFKKTPKIFMYGPSHSGKTWGALKIAAGLVMKKRNIPIEEAWQHVLLIDTEAGRGTLFQSFGPFKYYNFKPPYLLTTIQTMIPEIQATGIIDVIIIDSFTHFWSKDGGILDRKDRYDATKGGNSYTNWNTFTSELNRTLDKILQSDLAFILTARAKSDTVLELGDNGKYTPRTYGLTPEVRKDIDFEFDFVFNVDKKTNCLLVEKAPPKSLNKIYEPIDETFGVLLQEILDTDAVVPKKTPEEIMENIRDVAKATDNIKFVQIQASGRKLNDLTEEELIKLEKDLYEEVKKKQIAKKK